MTRRRTALLALPAAVLLLAGCGSSDGGSGGDAGSSSAASGPISTDLSVEPAVPASSDAAPTSLVTDDVVTGEGDVADAGTTVDVKYVGAFYESGQVFDASWNRGADETLSFTVGGGQVIEGFDQGVEGMAVGGRRAITIPSDLGYGPNGQGPIPGGATLVFVVDLVSVS